MKIKIDSSNICYYNKGIDFKLNLLITIFIFFAFLLKINQLENSISELKESLELKKEKIDDESLSIDKDLIGMTYPDINFEEFKKDLIDKSHKKFLFNFMNKLQAKLIYLEKEINVTKLFSFYSIRTSYLHQRNIQYDDEKIISLDNIINWAVIHDSNQLKGIASDKYLGCKYAKIKLGENICQQRKRVYNSVDEINFVEIANKGNIVLKVSNGCQDSVFIYKNSTDIKKIREQVKKYFQRDYGLNNVPEFFHLYSKKRIIEETMFEPITDLYEFKYFVVNRKIKFFLINFQVGNKVHKNFYDFNYNLIDFYKNTLKDFDLISTFGTTILDKLKDYVYKLSEDFKNFIRVDLYVFHKKIYLSELTFDSMNGYPFFPKEKIIIEAAKNFIKYE